MYVDTTFLTVVGVAGCVLIALCFLLDFQLARLAAQPVADASAAIPIVVAVWGARVVVASTAVGRACCGGR